MKILAIQGSPRGKAGNTEFVLHEFLKGAESVGARSETIYLKEKKIKPCKGCFTCWTTTPGLCAIKDDMAELMRKVRECDIIIYATPLYYYNMTAQLKAFQDRLLPLLDPHLIKKGDTYRHPQRYEHSRKMVLLSNCGFPETTHFDGLRHVFRQFDTTPLIGEILVPAGELLKQENLRSQRTAIYKAIFQAGVELIKEGRVSEKTEKIIQDPIFSTDDIAAMGNLWWDSYLSGKAEGKPQVSKIYDIRLILRVMAIAFNPAVDCNLNAVIQFSVTGKQPGEWFLAIKNGHCTFNEGVSKQPSLTIKTPSEIWLAIANKEIDGQQAFVKGKYTAEGDMELMMNMKNLFMK